MKTGSMTVGTTAVVVPISGTMSLGLKLLARDDNSSDVYMGVDSSVTSSTGSLVAKGVPAEAFPTIVPPPHFSSGGAVYLVGGGADQVVDYWYQ